MIKSTDRIKIDYFNIEGTPGGSQNWFTDFWMHIGGCGALAACDLAICLSKNLGFSDCFPYNPRKLTKEQYISFAMMMKSYIRPRIGGVTKTSVFTAGFGKYLRDCGYEPRFAVCQGEEDYVKACRFVKAALAHNLPIAYLMLHHTDKRYDNLSWHWFVITGYERKNGRIMLTYHTYGGVYKVDLYGLWHTGKRWKGGMVAVAGLKKVPEEQIP